MEIGGRYTNTLKIPRRIKYPEKYAATLKSSIYVKRNPGFQNHHWSYALENSCDTIRVSDRDHKHIHTYLIYDQGHKCYHSLEGDILDTRQKHINYIKFVVNTKPYRPGKLPAVEYELT